MAIFCPEKNSAEFKSLVRAIGEPLAYLVNHRSKGEILDIIAQGKNNELYNKLLSFNGRGKTKTLQHLAIMYSDKYYKEAVEVSEEVKPIEKETPASTETNVVKRLNVGRRKTTKVEDLSDREGSDASFSLADEQEYTIWDEAKELTWFREMFPNVPIDVLAGVKEVGKYGGVKAWGVFVNGMVQIAKNAKEGTIYHEAFHVVFHMFLTPSEAQEILNERRGNENLTDKQVEELLADEYRDYQLSSEIIKPIGGRVQDFFKRIYAAIKYYLTGELNANVLFKRISSGYYRNLPFTQDASQITNTIRYSTQIPGLNFMQQEARAINVSDMIREYLNEQYLNAGNVNRADFVKSFLSSTQEEENEDGIKYTISGVDLLLREAIYKLDDHYNALIKAGKLTPEREQLLNIMLNEIVDAPEGNLPDNNFKLKNLGILALRKFAISEGVTIKTPGLTFSGLDNLVDSEELSIDEDTIKKQSWEEKNIETAKSGSIRTEVKAELSYIPQLNEEGKQQYDALLLPKYLDGTEIFSTLIREMSDYTTEGDMEVALEDFIQYKPEYKHILNKFRYDSKFRSSFFHSFQSTHAKHRDMIRKFDKKTMKYTYIFKHSNQNNATSLIDEWKNNFYNPARNKLLDKEGNFDSKSESFKRMTELLGKTSRTKNEFIELAKLVGIDVTLKELNIMQNTKVGKTTSMTIFGDSIMPIINMYIQGRDPYEEGRLERNLLMKATLQLVKIRPEVQESSHRSIENKTIYSHISQFFASRQIQALKDAEIREIYLKDPFYSKMPWLIDMHNQEFHGVYEFYKNNFEYSLFGGKRWDGDSKGTSYDKLSQEDLELVKIQAFLSTEEDSNVGYFMMPPLSNAPASLFITAKKEQNREDVLNKLYNVALSEWERINTPVDITITNYNDIANRASQFHFIPVLNNHKDLFKTGNKEEIIKIINQYLDEKYNELVEDLKKMNLVGEVKTKSGIALTSKTISSKLSLDRSLKQYSDNYILANTQMISLFQGDPAFYKNTSDFFKRAKEIWSPGIFLNTDAKFYRGEKQVGVREFYNTIYINDVEISSEELGKEIRDALIAGTKNRNFAFQIAARYGFNTGVELYSLGKKNENLVAIDDERVTRISTEKEGDKLVTKYYSGDTVLTDVIAPYYIAKKTNVTDAQAFIRLFRFREIMVGMERWTDELDDAYESMIVGKESNITFQPFKPFVFTHRFLNNLVLPTQNKNSEFLLVPSLAYATESGVKFPTQADRDNNFKDYAAPKLAKILDRLDSDESDSLQFHSAVKVGLTGNTDFDDMDKAIIHKLKNKDYRIQQETPDHFTDDSGIVATQPRKLIIADISEDAIFELLGRTDVSKEELVKHYQELVTADIIDAFTQVDNRFQTIEDIQELLMEEASKRQMGTEMEKALTITTDTNGKSRFLLPLFTPFHAKRVESLVSSVYKNKVIRHKAAGGNLIQASGVGFMNDLKIIVENGRLKEVQVRLPYWMKEKMPQLVDENGKPDIKKFEELGIDRLLGYRIPTEDKYSMLPLKIVGFLPRESGGAIMLPPEITTITGSDFDVDKMYIMFYALSVKRNENGEISSVEKIKYNNNVKIEDYRKKISRVELQEIYEKYKNKLNEIDLKIDRSWEKQSSMLKSLFKDREANKLKRDELSFLRTGLYLKNKELNFRRKEIVSFLNEFEIGMEETPEETILLASILGYPADSFSILNLIDVELKEVENEVEENVSLMDSISDSLNSIPKISKDIKERIDKRMQRQTELIEEKYKLTFDRRDEINETLEKSISQQDFDKISTAEKNTKKARDNAKLDLFLSVLTNKDTFQKIVNPGNFDRLIDLADRIKKKLKISEELEIATPRTNREMFARYMAGNTLIGMFANHNVNHAILQHGKVFINKPISLNGREADSLSNIYDENGDYISRNIAEFSAAVVDNATNPISYYLNVNPFTADIVAYLLRAQFSIRTAIAFVNQPYIRLLTEEYTRNGADTKAYKNAYNTTKTFLTNRGAKASNTFDISTDTMVRDISPVDDKKGNRDYYNRQLGLLELFDKLRDDGFTSSKVVNVFRTDNIKRQLTMSSNDIMMRNKADLDVQKVFSGLDTAWKNFSMMESFYKYGVEEVTKRMADYFLWNNRGLKSTRDEIANNLSGNKNLNQDQIESVNFEMLFYLSQDFFNVQNKEDLIKKFPDEFNKYMEANPELKVHPLLKGLLVEPKKVNGISHSTITFKNTGGLTETKKATISEMWQQLIEHPEHGEFGKNLIKYSFMTRGFYMGPKTFNQFIPVEWYANVVENGQTFSDYLYNLQEQSKTDTAYDSFVDQFYRNHWENEFYVPTIEMDTFVDSFKLDPKKKQYDEYKLVNDRTQFTTYMTITNEAGKKQLYRNIGGGVFKKDNPLGLTNFTLEYDKNSVSLQSMYDENNKGNKVSTPKVVTKTTTPKQAPVETITNKSSKQINIYSTNKNGFQNLSNILNGPVKAIIEGKELNFKTVEHLFQTKKALFAGDKITANKIFYAKTGWDAQKLGRTVKNLNSKEWDKVSSQELESAMRLAFQQNKNNRDLLLSTGDATLTHNSNFNLGKWTTEFPKILMKIRSELSTSKQALVQTTSKESTSSKPLLPTEEDVQELGCI